MKRLVPAAILALLLHALILVLPSGWLPGRREPVSHPRPVTMTLSYRVPSKPAAAPEQISPPPQKNTAGVPPGQLKKEQKPPIPKARPKIRKPEKKKVRPRPASVESPPATSPPEPASSPKKETSREITAVPDRPVPGGVYEFSPGTTATRGQGLQGRHEPPPDPEPPPLVRAVPVYRKNPPPPYPRPAKRRGYEGTVLLEVLIGREGKVKDLRIVHSSGYPVLDKAARSSVEEWEFEPGKRGDEMIEMWVRIPVRFRLK